MLSLSIYIATLTYACENLISNEVFRKKEKSQGKINLQPLVQKVEENECKEAIKTQQTLKTRGKT